MEPFHAFLTHTCGHCSAPLLRLGLSANNDIVAGTYAVNGAVATFTPLTPLPGGATIRVYAVRDA